MNVLTIYAHPNPKSFCHAVLEQFTKGLTDAGHSNEIVDLYAIGFDPVLRDRDAGSKGTATSFRNFREFTAKWQETVVVR